VANFSRQIATAKRLIEANGEACTWNIRTRTPNASQPWKPTGAEVEHECVIFWYTLNNNQGVMQAFVQSLGQSIPEGVLFGLLPGDCGFVPGSSDEITRSDGSNVTVQKLDPLAPAGMSQVILWYVTAEQ
jgi:hypothetical protein